MTQKIGPREMALREAREALAKGKLFPKSLARIEQAIDEFAKEQSQPHKKKGKSSKRHLPHKPR